MLKEGRGLIVDNVNISRNISNSFKNPTNLFCRQPQQNFHNYSRSRTRFALMSFTSDGREQKALI